MIKLYSSPVPGEVEAVCSMLTDEGIEAVVLGEALGMARGDVPLTQETEPAVFVKPDDADAALKLVNQYLEDRQLADRSEVFFESWVCPVCGEQIEPQFDSCWNCEAERELAEDG